MVLSSERCLLSLTQYAQLLNCYDSFVPIIRNLEQAFGLYKIIEYLSRFVWCCEEDAAAMLVNEVEMRNALDNLRSQMTYMVKLSIQLSLDEKVSMTDVQMTKFNRMRKHMFAFIAVTSICHNMNEAVKRRFNDIETQEEH